MIGSVDTQTGNFETFYWNGFKNETNASDSIMATTCSSSLAGIFPFRSFKGFQMIDGGTAYGLNMVSGIQKCLDKVDTQEDIILDAITLLHTELNRTNSTGKTL